MINKRKLGFRIWVLFSIVLSLLIPLLSSPVAAAFTKPHGTASTDNTPSGPTATGSTPSGGDISDSAPWTAKFSIDWTYKDTNTSGSGSTHWMVISVDWQPGGTGPYMGPTRFTQNVTTIGANGGTRTGTFTTIPGIQNYGGIGTNFEVIVEVYCKDTASGVTDSWIGPGQTYTVI
jgi:hypothetical protein